MRRQILGLLGVGLVAVGLLSVRALEAQSPTPNNGGSFVPNTVLRIAGVWLNNKLLWDYRPPTIASGFGTSASIASHNGTAAFRVNVGTGGTATSGVLTLPRANAGWNCTATNAYAPVGYAAFTVITASSTTSVTLTALLDNGTSGAWKPSAELIVACNAY